MPAEFTSTLLPLKSRLDVWRPWSGPLALILVAVLLESGGEHWRTALRYDRVAIADGELWRLLSGNFVHLGWWHLLLNGLSLVLLVMLCPDRLSAGEWLRRILLLCLGMSAGLYFLAPGLATYVGLSGMIYGLFVLGLGRQAAQRDGIAILCLLFLACRVGWELVIGAPASEEGLIGGKVVAESHLFGGLSALVYGFAFRVFRFTPKAGAPSEREFRENAVRGAGEGPADTAEQDAGKDP
jgi:rhomboid family GlyGly-CTERM serine protease